MKTKYVQRARERNRDEKKAREWQHAQIQTNDLIESEAEQNIRHFVCNFALHSFNAFRRFHTHKYITYTPRRQLAKRKGEKERIKLK